MKKLVPSLIAGMLVITIFAIAPAQAGSAYSGEDMTVDRFGYIPMPGGKAIALFGTVPRNPHGLSTEIQIDVQVVQERGKRSTWGVFKGGGIRTDPKTGAWKVEIETIHGDGFRPGPATITAMYIYSKWGNWKTGDVPVILIPKAR